MRSTAKLMCGVAVTAALLVSAPTAHAGAIVLDSFDGNFLARNDDDSTDAVAIGFDINFYGKTYSNLFVNNNGNVTFDAALFEFTPFELLSTDLAMIAPFFGDVDTRPDPESGFVTYGTDLFDGNAAFGVNWLNVGYYDQQFGLLNSFQLIMVDRSDTGAGNFDFMFNYDQILWETGEASGGIDGCGGFSARAGYSNGVDTAFELEGSAQNGAFVDAASPCNGGSAGAYALTLGSLNSDIAGRYLFEVRNGLVVDPGAAVPEPATLVMLGTGLLVVGGLAHRRRRRQ